MDAIALLKKDHKTVEELFTRFEKLGPRAVKAKQDVVERIITELSVHAFIEETVFYPTIRQTIEDEEVKDLVLESLEEHHIVKWTLSELEAMNPEDERYSAKVTVLMESVRHHVEEEEEELFPKLEQLMGKERLEEMGNAMAEAKKRAPTHPHPRSPDEPPGNLFTAPAALLIDKARDAGRKLLGTAARETGRKTGAAANKISSVADRAPAKAEQAANSAKRTAKRAPAVAKKVAKQTQAAAKRAPAKAAKAASTTRTAAADAKKTATTGRSTADRQAAARKAAATGTGGTRKASTQGTATKKAASTSKSTSGSRQ